MTDLTDFVALSTREHGLCVLSTVRADGTVQSSVVNAGVLAHPQLGHDVVGLVARGATRKIDNLRRDPRATCVARSGWQWVTVEGTVEIIGPDETIGPDGPDAGFDAESLRVLLQDVFRAAGGTHDDWDVYDRAMADERRAAVLLTPTRIYSNPA